MNNPSLWRRAADPSEAKQFDQRFENLLLGNLERHVGKFVRVPQLYDLSALAKGLLVRDCESFLLTEERYALWNEMFTARGSYENRHELNGLCLSGPNGVGKSSVLHLLASTAHVNGWLVLYIVRAPPRGASWLSPSSPLKTHPATNSPSQVSGHSTWRWTASVAPSPQRRIC